MSHRNERGHGRPMTMIAHQRIDGGECSCLYPAASNGWRVGLGIDPRAGFLNSRTSAPRSPRVEVRRPAP